MDELQRQGYLKAMGVDCFVPRLILPGAALSKQAVLPDYVVNAEAANSQAAAEISSAEDFQVGQPSSINALITETGLNAKAQRQFDAEKLPARALEPAANNSIPHSSSGSEKKPAKNPSFQLTLTTFSAGIMVISSVEQTSIGHQLFCRSLLNEIIQAFKLGNTLLSEPELFSWPMVQSVQIDQSAAIAVETLRATVAAKTNKYGAKIVLLFGRDAARYLLNDEDFAAVIGREFTLAGLPPMLVTHSLSQLLQTPILKKTTLQHLLPLFDFARRL